MEEKYKALFPLLTFQLMLMLYCTIMITCAVPFSVLGMILGVIIALGTAAGTYIIMEAHDKKEEQ